MSRTIVNSASAGTAVFWGFALLWNLIAAPALLFFPRAIRTGNHLWWLALLFPLVGIALLLNAMRLTWRALRFRNSTLLLETAPLGGTLRGHVAVPHPLNGVSAVMIRLIALSRRRSGNETHDAIVAHEERELAPSLVQRMGVVTMIPIEIGIPADAPPAEADKVFWRLSVDAEVPGVDYHSTFDVPVARTEFGDLRPHGPADPIAEPVDPQSYVERQTPEGRELYFRPFRAPLRAFVSVLVTIVWLGAIAFTMAIDVPRLITVGLAIIAIFIVLNTLEMFFESHTIRFGPHEITFRRRMLVTREHKIAIGDIDSASTRLSMQTSGARPYYRVDVETKSGERINAAKHIRSKREADWVASRIKRRS